MSIPLELYSAISLLLCHTGIARKTLHPRYLAAGLSTFQKPLFSA
jgi:hypothetical protein